MKSLLFTFAMLGLGALASSQQLYFPPNNGEWETTSPEELGWCTDSLLGFESFLDDQNSKAFILLKDGKIVLEYYFDEFTADSLWYWASAGKSLEGFLVGCAQEDGFLNINQSTSDFLGEGWTSLTSEQEAEITILNQLTMTTGLDDGVENVDCTDPECLTFLSEPGQRWAYHNAPYTLLSDVLENAVGQTPNAYIFNKLTVPAGIDVYYVPLNYNKVAFSTARNMAKFGLLSMNRGTWDGTGILSDSNYFDAMVTPSQSLNPSYGYLWWLNGQSSYMLPGLQFDIPGSVVPEAPESMVAAIGKNNQIINVVEDQGLVWIRMGEASSFELVPTVLNNEIWTYLNQIICNGVGVNETEELDFTFGPNPCKGVLKIKSGKAGILKVLDLNGKVLISAGIEQQRTLEMDVSQLPKGPYVLNFTSETESLSKQLILD